MVQSNNFIEAASHKIRRQIEDLERVSGINSSSLSVDGVPVDSYLTRWQCLAFTFCWFNWLVGWFLWFESFEIYGCRFVWDEARYPTMSPLKEIVDGIHVQVAKIEDDLKVNIQYSLCALPCHLLTRRSCHCDSLWCSIQSNSDDEKLNGDLVENHKSYLTFSVNAFDNQGVARILYSTFFMWHRHTLANV